MTTPSTPYAETEALLAVMEALDASGRGRHDDTSDATDYANVDAILSDMHPTELDHLIDAARRLAHRAGLERARRR